MPAIPVNHDCSAHDFLESINKSYQDNIAFPLTSQTFCLRTDSQTNASYPEGSPIPRQILCTVKEYGMSRLLGMEISEEISSFHARFVAQLLHVTSRLLVAASCGQTLRDFDLVCNQDRQDLQRWNQQPPLIVASTVHEIIR